MKRHAVMIEDSQGEGGVSAENVFLTPWLRRQKTADVIFTPGDVDHRSVAEDQAQGQ